MRKNILLPKQSFLGENALTRALPSLSQKGKKALIVTGGSMLRQGHVQRLQELLAAQGVENTLFSGVTSEPSDTMIEDGVAAYKSNHCDFLIGFGGGSQLDAAKAIGAMLVHDGKMADYDGKAFTNPLPPLVAIPSTAGTGSEATAVTIIRDTQRDIKMLLKGEVLLPQLAVVDPVYTWNVPQSVTVATGLDALTHAIETYTSRYAFPECDAYALKAINRIFENLPLVFENGDNHAAREQMSIAAYEAGIAICNSTVTLVHGMSRPVGAIFHVPHGLSNAMLLTQCLSFAVDGAEERFAALGRERDAAMNDASDAAAAQAFLAAVDKLCKDLQVPTLAQYGIDKKAFFDAIPKMARDAEASGSPANTRKPVTIADMEAIYRKVWEEQEK